LDRYFPPPLQSVDLAEQ
jgi:hypothetical protein